MWFLKYLAIYVIAISFSLCAAEEGEMSGKQYRKIDFKVLDNHCKEFKDVSEMFVDTISKWYGSQESALKKIGKSRDRLCELLLENDVPRGVIVFKKELQNGDLECKTLSLLNPVRDSKKGYGSLLLKRLIDSAVSRSASNIVLTVNSKNSAKDFFLKSGFTVIEEQKDKFKKGETEYTLSYSIEKAHDQKQDLSTIHEEKLIDLKGHDKSATDSHKAELLESGNKVIHCTLKREYVEAIRSGSKTYEGRVATAFFKDYTPGKQVEWRYGDRENEKVLTKILSRQNFTSFEKMLEGVGYKKFLPTARSFEEACNLYHSVPGYSEKVKRNGALALEVRVVLGSDRSVVNANYSEKSEDKNFGDKVEKKLKKI